MNYQDAVQQFVVENFLFGEEGRIKEDTQFLEEGIVDSTGMLELVGFLEGRFHIHVEDDELIPANLNSLRSIGNYLERKLKREGSV